MTFVIHCITFFRPSLADFLASKVALEPAPNKTFVLTVLIPFKLLTGMIHINVVKLKTIKMKNDYVF